VSREIVVAVAGESGSPRTVRLGAYLDAGAAELAESEANAWIKSLRHAVVDGRPFRERFVHRGDSLWWFAELYLHKRRVIVEILRAVLSLEALIERERPRRLTLASGGRVIRIIGPQIAARHGVEWRVSRRWTTEGLRLRLSVVIGRALFLVRVFS